MNKGSKVVRFVRRARANCPAQPAARAVKRHLTGPWRLPAIAAGCLAAGWSFHLGLQQVSGKPSPSWSAVAMWGWSALLVGATVAGQLYVWFAVSPRGVRYLQRRAARRR